jgi:UDP-N-acetylglucosamine 2-epimerase (non-hydrolysing)
MTDNTVVDALKSALEIIQPSKNIDVCSLFPEITSELWAFLKDSSKKLILVTAHRRENFATGISNLAIALKEIALREDVFVIFPVHPNPNVKNQVEKNLSNIKNVFLLGPLGYLTFVYLMNQCYFLITDSGGIQEESSILGKPVLVTRKTSDRQETIDSGTAMLVGANTGSIVNAAKLLLTNETEYKKMAVPNSIYGDGRASDRIVAILAEKYSAGMVEHDNPLLIKQSVEIVHSNQRPAYSLIENKEKLGNPEWLNSKPDDFILS